jgi:hypothetical protein
MLSKFTSITNIIAQFYYYVLRYANSFHFELLRQFFLIYVRW